LGPPFWKQAWLEILFKGFHPGSRLREVIKVKGNNLKFADLNRLLLQLNWLFVAIGLGFAAAYALLGRVSYSSALLFTLGTIPFLAATLLMWRYPHLRGSPYVLGFGLATTNLGFYAAMGSWFLFYTALFTQAMVSLYQDRRLLWGVVSFQAFAYTMIFLVEPRFIAAMPRPDGSLGNVNAFADVYVTLLLGGLWFDLLTKYL
jgi:hypothetical protein